ncbi:MAG: hypothetical protein ACK5Q5_23975 [Planctomycetaceae bacterium]
MAIDPFKDELIDLANISEHLPEPVSGTTVLNWWKNRFGDVRLETVKIARKRYTTRAALAEFFRQRTALDVKASAPTESERSPELTEQLRRAGLL